MKKAKKLGLQSLALVLMAFVLVAGVAFGMTGAWFVDKDIDSATVKLGNAVNFNKSATTLVDSKTGAFDQYGDAYSEGIPYYFPGSTVTLNGTIKLADGSADAQVRAKVTVTYDGTAANKSDFTVTVMRDQTAITPDGTGENEYAKLGEFEGGTSPAAQNYTVTVAIGGNITNTEAGKILTITVQLEAGQDANFEANETAIWTASAAVVVS